jgi:DNA-binding NtrC family response regulator
MMAADFNEPYADGEPRATVLIVEDEVLIRMLLSEALRSAGFEVIEAADADEALAVLHTSPCPDTLITDVKMPGQIDGLGLAQIVRRTQPQLKVIVTSGHAAADAATEIADAFVRKPYDLGGLVRQVRALTSPR